MAYKKTDRYDGFTQQQWDRVVGYGKVPKEYQKQDAKDGTSTDKRHKRSVRNTAL